MRNHKTTEDIVKNVLQYNRFHSVDSGFHTPAKSHRMWSADPRKLSLNPWRSVAINLSDEHISLPEGALGSHAGRLITASTKELLALHAAAEISDIPGRLDAWAVERDIGVPMDPAEFAALAAAYGDYHPGRGISFREHMSRLYGFRVERGLRAHQVSDLDREFMFAQANLYSECFQVASACETICLDVNSIFPWAIASKAFPNPGRLEIISGALAQKKLSAGCLDNGIFRCRVSALSGYAEMLSAIGPFWLGSGGGVPVRIGNAVLGLRLHAADLAALAPYCHIEILDGICSPQSISHPLAATAKALYLKKSLATGHERAIAKAALTTLHASTMRFTQRTARIRPGDTHPLGFVDLEMGAYSTIVGYQEDSAVIAHYDVENSANVYSLTTTVYAHARAHMFSLMAALWSKDAKSIFYSNIDSLHVAKSGLDAIENHIGDKLGDLKIEAFGDQGLWVSPGMYQIKMQGRAVKAAGNGPPGSEGKIEHFEFVIDDAAPPSERGQGLQEIRIVRKYRPTWRNIAGNKRLSGNTFKRVTPDEAATPTLIDILAIDNRRELRGRWQHF